MKNRLVPALAIGLVLAAPAAAQCDVFKALATDAAGSDLFGNSVAVSGDIAIAGAWFADGPGFSAGAAYVFERQGSGWSQTKLTASDAAGGDRFGNSVSVSGTWALVGAYLDTVSFQSDSGSAYLYKLTPNGWDERLKFVPSDMRAGQKFGSAVAIASPTALVGAEADDDHGPFAGAAYVFRRVNPTTWVEVTKLTAADASSGAVFGREVALTDGVALVGAELDDVHGADSGSAYVFERTPAGWVQTAKLVPDIGAAGEFFGASVAVAADVAVVGASRDSSLGEFAGSAYVFERAAGGWVQTAKLTAPDARPFDGFGTSVALSGSRVLVGSFRAWGQGELAGAAYLFERTPAGWELTDKLAASGGHAFDSFGTSVAISGDRVVVGASGDDEAANAAGAAWLMTAPDFATGYGFCAGGPCGNPDPVAGCANSTGRGAVLGACGSASTAADDLVLTAGGLPENQTGLLFRGGLPAAVPFGDGLLAVGPGATGLFRFPARSSGPTGSFSEGPGIVAFSQTQPDGGILAGQTCYFQAWYRDPTGPCQSGFGFSNATEVTFVP